MRVFGVCATFLLTIAVVAAQAPAPKRVAPRPAVPAPAARPDGDLAQLMRGILFPNSNLLFDVQENDPGAPPKKDDSSAGPSHSYANVYDGWQVVEGAAVALEESADLILRPGRSCSNGKPAPVGRADYMKFAQQLREAGRKTLVAAKAKSQSQVSDLTNDVADACANCHEVYRDKGPAGSPARCTP